MRFYLISVAVNATDSINDSVWSCPKQYYWCSDSCTHLDNYVCDGANDCGGIDEKYCDHTVS